MPCHAYDGSHVRLSHWRQAMISNYKIRQLNKDLSNLTALTYRVPSQELGAIISKLHMVNLLHVSSQYSDIQELLHGFKISKDKDHHLVTISSRGDNGNFIRNTISNMLFQGYEPINPENGDQHHLVKFLNEIFADNNNTVSGHFKINDTTQDQPVASNRPFYFTDELFMPLYNHAGLRLNTTKSSVVIDGIKNGWSSAFKPHETLALEHDAGFSFVVKLGYWVMSNMDKLKDTGLNHMGLFLWMLNKKEDFNVAN